MTHRYMQIAQQNWADLDGYAMGHGMPPLRSITVDRFCNWLWWMLTRNAKDQAEKDSLRAKIWQPPAGSITAEKPIDPRSPWSPENEAKAFASLKMQLMPTKLDEDLTVPPDDPA